MNYTQKIRSIHEELGIPQHYAKERGLTLQVEAETLELVETREGREFHLIPEAAQSWVKLKTAAEREQIILQVGSAFRSVDRQVQLVRGKLERGLALDEILRALAAPGYSEHHTGRAVDVITVDSAPFLEEFEKSEAFAWLQANAQRYHFFLSFPRNNTHGIMYEPWHWCYALE